MIVDEFLTNVIEEEEEKLRSVVDCVIFETMKFFPCGKRIEPKACFFDDLVHESTGFLVLSLS